MVKEHIRQGVFFVLAALGLSVLFLFMSSEIGPTEVEITDRGLLSEVKKMDPNVNIHVPLAVTAKDNSGASATAQISVAINDEEVKTLSRAIQKMEEVGARPVLDRSDDVAGPDVNQDGVRDDIAAFIAGLPATDQQKAYLMTYAVGIQKQATYTPGSLEDPDQHARDMAQATVCVLSSFEDFEQAVLYHKQVQNYTANTKERARRLFAYSQSRNGTVVRLPSKDNCTTSQ